MGDVKRGPMTANAALHDAKIAAANAVLGNQVKRNYFKVPVVINSALEIAAVGLSEEQADAAGFAPEVARASLGGCVKARAHHDYRRLLRGGARHRDRPASRRLHRRSGGGRADPPARRRLPVAAGPVAAEGHELQPPVLVRGTGDGHRSLHRGLVALGQGAVHARNSGNAVAPSRRSLTRRTRPGLLRQP
ncbi:MAG: hypothetical protein MZW92_79015 [Comamonadaceae bacterium]|nr:hypothetical protein [Comamonadaceae bacterium]